jgi:drug/metabolite transporter (DMT)-like permease
MLHHSMLTATLFLVLSIVGSTLMWPLNRRVADSGSRPLAYGFWISATGAVTATLVSLATRQDLANPRLWLVGAVMGAAFAFGYCFALQRCVAMGPLGPSAAVNNMGLLWPVVIGAVWLDPHPLGAPAWIGLAAVAVSLLLFGAGSGGGDSAKRLSMEWGLWALATWAASGVSMSAQLMGSLTAPESPVPLVAACLATSTVLLAPFAARARAIVPTRLELAAGAANGLFQVAGVTFMLLALRNLPVEVVFPFAIGAPLIATLVIGRLVYRDAVSPAGWAASGVGLAGLVLLSLR